ncbi:hypothetical protein BCO37747_03136 [Burkholderia contaminans]|nr:hypothetical protein BCO23253_04501 [Burkholderia contaminans]VWD09806.1 hypothetical protein BCO37747_03136 [Burkholderia contaminans]
MRTSLAAGLPAPPASGPSGSNRRRSPACRGSPAAAVPCRPAPSGSSRRPAARRHRSTRRGSRDPHRSPAPYAAFPALARRRPIPRSLRSRRPLPSGAPPLPPRSRRTGSSTSSRSRCRHPCCPTSRGPSRCNRPLFSLEPTISSQSPFIEKCKNPPKARNTKTDTASRGFFACSRSDCAAAAACSTNASFPSCLSSVVPGFLSSQGHGVRTGVLVHTCAVASHTVSSVFTGSGLVTNASLKKFPAGSPLA